VRQVEKHNGERKTISLTPESSEFHFSDVIPGKYRLEVDFFLFFLILHSHLICGFSSRISLVVYSFISGFFFLIC